MRCLKLCSCKLKMGRNPSLPLASAGLFVCLQLCPIRSKLCGGQFGWIQSFWLAHICTKERKNLMFEICIK